MSKYHVNPQTGRANQCRATKACPFGGEDVHFENRHEARQHFEREMSGQTIAVAQKRRAKNIAAPNKFRLRHGDASGSIEYDYDSYDCSSPYECAESNDYCRDKVYEGLRAVDITPAQVHSYVGSVVGLNYNEPLPESLQQAVDAHMDEWTDAGNWEAYGVGDYYGESVAIDPPPELVATVDKWFYSQPGAMDDKGILPYLRGMGFDTTGKKPVQAVKDFLAEHNGGKRLPSVEAAREVEVTRVNLKRIRVPNPHHYEQSEARAPEPMPETGQKQAIAGILLETTKGTPSYNWRTGYTTPVGEVKLLDGYHRLKHLQEQARKSSGTYLVLRK